MSGSKNREKGSEDCCPGWDFQIPAGSAEKMSEMMKACCSEDGSFDCSAMMEMFKDEDGSFDVSRMMDVMKEMMSKGK